jgi:hypothetical protein
MPLKKNSPAVEALAHAAKGLVWVSDREAPFEAFSWPTGPLSDAEVRQHAGVHPDTAVETMSLDDFLCTVPGQYKPKFDKLVAVLKQMPGVKVYKVGDQAGQKLFIVGRSFDGSWVGVKTTAVES